MRRLRDYDEYRQGQPKNKPIETGLTSGGRNPLYVTTQEFEDMQTELKVKIDEQVTILERVLNELRQMKLHLASLSGETTETEDGEDSDG